MDTDTNTTDTTEKTYGLWFQNESGTYIFRGTYLSKEEAMQGITQTEEYKEKHRYYMRTWFGTDKNGQPDENHIIVDYGEHNTFFNIVS